MYSMQVVPFSDAIAVSLTDAKLHLRVDHSTEDALITRLIHAATDTAQSYTGRQIRNATITLKLPRLPSGRDLLYLPRPALIDLTAFDYYNASDSNVDLSGDCIQYTGELSCLEPSVGDTWPSVTTQRAFPVSISYQCGYSTTAAVPDLIKQAILLLVGHLYENRETVNVGNIVNEFPLGFRDLLMPYVVGDEFRQFEPTSLSEARDNAQSR
jgi:uncharacterized phiE125 gp8 family phage protein